MANRTDHTTRQSSIVIRDRTWAKVEANKAAVANLFRRAVKAKCEQWNAGRAVEKLLGVELELADTLGHFAAGIDNAADASATDADEAVNAVIVNVVGEGDEG
ncbi:MAG: hypothetical protein K2V38_09355 [Gemmataceae bacterium]|nr:hypothetical protein [Gemmataceae bacterium]